MSTNNLQQRFEHVLSQRLQDFEKEQQVEKRRQKALQIINVFRALFTGPLVPGYHPIQAKNNYRSVMAKITETEALPWADLDSSRIPPEHSIDVSELQAVLFDQERHRNRIIPKAPGLFGALSVDSLQRDYLGDDV